MIFLVRAYTDRNGPATRQEILNALGANPGLTKTQLCRKLGLSWGTISHHVRVLADNGELTARRLHGWSRLYLPSTPGLEAALMPLLRDDSVPRILAAVMAHPGLSIKDLASEVSETRKVMRRYLRTLVDAGAVERRGAHRPKFYLGPQVDRRIIEAAAVHPMPVEPPLH